MILNLTELKEKYKIHTTGIMHIGAHYGEEYNEYRNIFGDVPIVMWEASSENFNILKQKLYEEKNLTLINKGIGPFECEVGLYKETANTGQSNSVLKPSLHIKQYPHIRFDAVETIKLFPLDKWQPDSNLNFLNIDIQGFELHAFLGAKKTLKNVNYIITEVNREELYENCAFVDEIDWFLGRFGFKRVETNWAGGSWGDALYIKNLD